MFPFTIHIPIQVDHVRTRITIRVNASDADKAVQRLQSCLQTLLDTQDTP